MSHRYDFAFSSLVVCLEAVKARYNGPVMAGMRPSFSFRQCLLHAKHQPVAIQSKTAVVDPERKLRLPESRHSTTKNTDSDAVGFHR